ncbi:MAG: DUF4099 domain-containing protein [Tannerella sp.]|jgi:hypothetical protein|nr:DUF4099 domain-containing protein [Tannerella sp.]
MSDGTDDVARLQRDIADVFNQLFFGLGQKKSNNHRDYFSVNQENNNVSIKSHFDGQKVTPDSRKELEKFIAEEVQKTNTYNSTIDDAIGKNRENAGDIFTPKVFMDLGGHNSDLLKCTDKIDIVDFQFEKHIQLNLSKSSSYDYDGVMLNANPVDNEYMIGFRKKGESEFLDWSHVPADKLEVFIKEKTQLNEKAYLADMKKGFLFKENEIPMKKLKEAGIKWDELSAVNRNQLLKGRETSVLTVKGNGNNEYKKGHLKLQRTGADSAALMFRQSNHKAMSIKFTPSLKI